MSKTSYQAVQRRGGLYVKRAKTAITIGGIFILVFFTIALSILLFAHTDQSFSFRDALQLAVKWLYADGDFPLDEQPWFLVAANLFAPFLLPILGVFAFVDSLRLRLWLGIRRLLPFGRARPLVVVIGLGDKGLEIVKSAHRDGNEIVVIEQNPDNPLIREAGVLGVTVWIGDGSSRIDLAIACWRRPSRLWIMTNLNDVNLKILDQVNALFADKKSGSGSGNRLDVYLSIDEAMDIPDVITLASLNIASPHYYVHLTHMEEDAAMWLLRRFPMALRDGKAPRVLVIGLGEQGRAIMKELYMLCHYPETNLPAAGSVFNNHRDKWSSFSIETQRRLREWCVPEIVAVEKNAANTAKLKNEFSFLEDPVNEQLVDFPVVHVLPEQDVQSWTFGHYKENVRAGDGFTHIFVSIGSDTTNIAFAERIWAWEMALDASSATTIVPIIYERESESWVRLNECSEKEPDKLLYPFCVDDAYSSDALEWRVGLEAMAKRVNKAYGGTERWFQLSQEKRRSNLANARALQTRFPYVNTFGNSEELVADEADIERDAECEHRRWNAYVLLAGIHFTQLPDADVKFKGVKLRDLARVNANLVPYYKLDGSIKEYDRKMVRQRHEILSAFNAGQSNS